jgi:hypothetical protein
MEIDDRTELAKKVLDGSPADGKTITRLPGKGDFQ